jgi:exosortase
MSNTTPDATPLSAATAPSPRAPEPFVPSQQRWRWRPALIALGCVPLLLQFFANLWQKPHYRFFPLAVAGAIFLLQREWRKEKAHTRGEWKTTAALLVVAVLTIGAGTALYSPWLGASGSLVLLTACAFDRGGWKLLRRLLKPALPLLLIIPPPFNADESLTLKLKWLAVTAGSRVLDAFSIPHALNGNVLDIPHQRLFVEDACTGINSILFVAAATWLLSVWRNRGWLHCIAASALNLSFVVLGNLARIVIATIALYHFKVDLLHGWAHETIGLLLFAMYIGLIFSTDRLVVIMVAARPSRRNRRGYGFYGRGGSHRSDQHSLNPLHRPLPSIVMTYLAGLMALFGLAQITVGFARTGGKKAEIAAVRATERLDFKLPDRIGSWNVENTSEPTAGLQHVAVHSKVWEYRSGNIVASIAIDYPFPGFHDVTACYVLQGWKLKSEVLESGQNEHAAYNRSALIKGGLIHGTLLFGLNESTGEPLKPEVRVDYNRFTRWERGNGHCYQVQVLVQSFAPLQPADEAQVRDFFFAVRRALVAQAVVQTKKA